MSQQEDMEHARRTLVQISTKVLIWSEQGQLPDGNRIQVGDPNYADSWVDIAGYAKLVADRLEGVER